MVFMPRQFRPSVCLSLSVRPLSVLSVTRVICIKTAEHIIEILSLSDIGPSFYIYSFSSSGCCVNLTASPVQLVSKISNLLVCDLNPPTSHTDRRTTFDRN